MGLEDSFFVRIFLYFHTSCLRVANALTKECIGLSEQSLLTRVISTKISCASPYGPCFEVCDLVNQPAQLHGLARILNYCT